MKLLTTLVLSALLGVGFCRRFPPGFKFGAATAAYQVEGAWNVSDKSPSIWDTFVHTRPEIIADRSNGDVACDSYNQWMKDVEIASELGLDFYRFSLSWPRILPYGFANKISEDGVKFYSNLIDALLERGIEPVVTIYHWDLPQNLQDLGGWTNPLISDWFADYARVVFSLYADRVKTWITLNEPLTFCDIAYNFGVHAPGIVSRGIGNYICNKNTMLAHAKAWRIYDKEFRPKYTGKVSLTNQIMWFEGADENDGEAAKLALQLMGGLYSHPIYSKKGGWPEQIERLIAEKSKEEGYPQSKLPELTEEEKELIRGTYDFFGLNYYTSRTARRARGEVVGPWPLFGGPDIDVIISVRPEWPQAGTSWFYVHPQGLRKLISWVKEQYGDIEIFIAENGFATHGQDLDDQDRVDYYKSHLEQVHLAIEEDKANVVAYTAWTMIDNFEWSDGYRSKFGLYKVDFSDPARARRPRASAQFYKEIVKAKSLDVDSHVLDDEL
ncbi:myrosinase 1-like [Danaus plexippus]|uniref:myrosinase 1-like n=1 Tax=Danaus plexippus TaxID=13037 RepID=UPI002AB2EA90|nr:myrosinase 1-like [Danaus plexippus]